MLGLPLPFYFTAIFVALLMSLEWVTDPVV